MQTSEETSVATSAPPPNPLERRLDLTVSKADIDAVVDQRLKALARSTKMAGFRPGKVPVQLIAQQYGLRIRSEAIAETVHNAFAKRARAEKIKVAGGQTIEPGQGDDSDGLMHFTMVFEVFPEFELGDLSGQTIEKPTLTIGDAEIDQTIEVLRKQRMTWIDVDRPAALADRVVIDFSGRKDGEALEKATASDFTVTLGDGRMLADFEGALVGMSAGEQKVFPLTFPEDYHAEDLAGQTVEFTVTIKSVKAPKLPELDAEFARQMGIADGDLVTMRAEVGKNLEREVKKRLDARVKQQAMDALLAANPIPVPRSLVQEEAARMVQNARQDMQKRGFMANNMPIDASWFTAEAERRVRLGLIMAELMHTHDVSARPEQVRAIVEDYAESFENPQEVVRWYYNQSERLAEAQGLALENNVVAWVLAAAKVSEKPISFDELMGNATA